MCENILEKYDSVSGTYGTPPSKSMGAYIQRRFLHKACAALMQRLRSDPDMRLEEVLTDTIVRLVLTCAKGNPLSVLHHFLPALKQSASEYVASLMSDGAELTDDLRLRAVYLGLREEACRITPRVLSKFTFVSGQEGRLLILNFARGQSMPREVLDLVHDYITPDALSKELSNSLLPFYEAGDIAMSEITLKDFLVPKHHYPDKFALLNERVPQWKSLLPVLLNE